MGQVIVVFSKAGAPSPYGGMPVMEPKAQAVEELSTSGSATPTTITAKAGDVCRIVNNSSLLVWAKINTNPTAAVESDHPIQPNQSYEFGPCGEGDKVSVIDDS